MIINLSGLAAENLNTESIEYKENKDVKTLIEFLKSQSPNLSNINLYVSINDKLAEDKERFNEGDRVFVFNPYAGG